MWYQRFIVCAAAISLAASLLALGCAHSRRWDRRDAYAYGYPRGYPYPSDAMCGHIVDRIRYDRAKIREIEPTGRHRKALQWYYDDLANARRDLDRCRYG
jgi:hypothetical protein